MASREIERLRRKQKRDLVRSRATLSVSPTILIVCEGKNTEISYFNQLRFRSAKIVPVGEGYNTVSLVERAEEIANKERFDEVWCVFDCDDFPAHHFDNAIKMILNKGFKFAYSNQAFEYWIILHFNDHQGGPIHRSSYSKMINTAISQFGVKYDFEGSKIITPKLFNLMFSRDEASGIPRHLLAIERSKRIYDRFDHFYPSSEESSTTMHLLLEHLLEFERY